MKKVFLVTLLFLMGCSSANPTSSSNQTQTEDYKISVISDLNENEDYVSHAATFDGKDFAYDESMWYVNDLKSVPLPDPHIYEEDGTYYIVGTNDGNVSVITCYTTEDFNTFDKVGEIYTPAKYKGWESSNPTIYAPEMYCFDGKYYLYYSAISKLGNRENSVVVADSPTGPYAPIVNSEVDGLNNPVFAYDYDSKFVLDSTVFVDDDQQMYMYYSVADGNGQHIAGVKLTSPYTADWSTYTPLNKAGYIDSSFKEKGLDWEELRNEGDIVEGPYMLKSKGKYYLTYSANGCWNKYYNVCYAVSDSPLGNFVKPYDENKDWTNLLLGYPGDDDSNSLINNQWSGFASGTAHHCFFNIGDQLMIGYHAHQNRNWNGTTFTKRFMAIDYVYFDDDGVPFCVGPTWSIQPLPEAISGYKNIAENATVKSKNVENINYVNDNYVECYYNLIDGESKEVVLGKDHSFIEFVFDKEYTIGGISVYNSVNYENMIEDIKYIDFGDGNAIKYPEFCIERYTNPDYEFIHPGSAITIQNIKTIKSSKIVICFNQPNGAKINEIKILGK